MSPNWKNKQLSGVWETGVSWHLGVWIEGLPETPRPITALSYWGRLRGPVIVPSLCREFFSSWHWLGVFQTASNFLNLCPSRSVPYFRDCRSARQGCLVPHVSKTYTRLYFTSNLFIVLEKVSTNVPVNAITSISFCIYFLICNLWISSLNVRNCINFEWITVRLVSVIYICIVGYLNNS